jgi:hypothetical protein
MRPRAVRTPMGVDRVYLHTWSRPVKDMTATERIDEIEVSRDGHLRKCLVNSHLAEKAVSTVPATNIKVFNFVAASLAIASANITIVKISTGKKVYTYSLYLEIS